MQLGGQLDGFFVTWTAIETKTKMSWVCLWYYMAYRSYISCHMCIIYVKYMCLHMKIICKCSKAEWKRLPQLWSLIVYIATEESRIQRFFFFKQVPHKMIAGFKHLSPALKDLFFDLNSFSFSFTMTPLHLLSCISLSIKH